VKLITHLHLVLKFRMSRDILLIPLYALMVWTGQTLPIIYIEINMKYLQHFVYKSS
jgi:hypothetical protein